MIDLPFEIIIVPQEVYYKISLSNDYMPFEGELNRLEDYSEVEDHYTKSMQINSKVENSILRSPLYHKECIRYTRALMLDHRLQYELKYGMIKEAKMFADLINKYYPNYIISPVILSEIERIETKPIN